MSILRSTHSRLLRNGYPSATAMATATATDGYGYAYGYGCGCGYGYWQLMDPYYILMQKYSFHSMQLIPIHLFDARNTSLGSLPPCRTLPARRKSWQPWCPSGASSGPGSDPPSLCPARSARGLANAHNPRNPTKFSIFDTVYRLQLN